MSRVHEDQRSTTLCTRKQRVFCGGESLVQDWTRPELGKPRRQSHFCANGGEMIRVGVDVGGTFTDLVALDRGRVVTAKVPSTPEDQSRGCDAQPRGGRGLRRGGVRARDDGRHQRAARAPRRAHRARHHRGLPRPDRARAPGPPGALRPRGAPPRAARAARPALHRARAHGARRRGRAAGRGQPRRGDRRAARGGRRGGRGVPAVRVPASRPRAPRRRGGARGAGRRPRVALERGAARVPRVRALLHHRRRRLPGAEARAPTSSGWPRARRRRACRRRW